MNVDWLVAITTFLVLVIFAFNYYSAFFTADTDMSTQVTMIQNSVFGMVQADTSRLPVHYNSTEALPGKVLYFDYQWPENTKNSARVSLSGSSLQCTFVGDRLYFLSDVNEGPNVFVVSYVEGDFPLGCDDSFTVQDESKAVPWVPETVKQVTQETIDSLRLVGYSEFRNSIGVMRDFRIEFVNASGTLEYGRKVPENINVYVSEKNSRLFDTGEDMRVRVLVW
jgi:hypothetical protein